MYWIAFFIFFNLALFARSLDVEIRARSAILMNAENGNVLFEKDAHAKSFPASTTKIATALYVLDKGIDLNQLATVSAEALRPRPLKDRDRWPSYWLDSNDTIMGLKRGETLSLESLMHGLLLVSGNDAANVIAETLGGTVPQFMTLLNEYLTNIGCQETKFSNPHGSTHPEHYSTAYDMALIARKALKIPQFRKFVSTLSYLKPKTNKQPPTELRLNNALMKSKNKNYYPKAIGIKTGYTPSAKYNLVAAAEHAGRTLIAVTLGCEKSDHRYEDAKKLFDAAFAETKERRRLIGPENTFMKEIVGSKSPLKASVAKELVIDYFPSEEPKCKAALHWSKEILPIRKGQKVGEVHILDEDNGALLKQADLFATEEVKGTLFFVLKEKINRLFH